MDSVLWQNRMKPCVVLTGWRQRMTNKVTQTSANIKQYEYNTYEYELRQLSSATTRPYTTAIWIRANSKALFHCMDCRALNIQHTLVEFVSSFIHKMSWVVKIGNFVIHYVEIRSKHFHIVCQFGRNICDACDERTIFISASKIQFPCRYWITNLGETTTTGRILLGWFSIYQPFNIGRMERDLNYNVQFASR